MTSLHILNRTPFVFCCLALGAIVAAGCESPGPSVSRVAPQEPARAEAELSKELLTLDLIQPEVIAPTRNPEIPELSERAREQIGKAKILLADRRYTEAAIELERALRSDPNHPTINAVLAVLHWQAGNIERAKTHATRSIEASPELAAAHYVMGRYQAQAGESNAALYALRTAVICRDFGEDQELAALTRFHLADLLAQEGYATAALAQFGEFEKLSARLGGATDRLSFSAEFTNLLSTMPASIAEPRAKLLAQLGRHAEAAAALRVVVEQRPRDVSIARQYAEMLMNAGKLEDAFEAARTIPSNDEAVISLIYDICERLGQPDRAVAEIQSRVAQNPQDPELVFRLASILEQAGRELDARKALEAYLHDHPDSSEARMRLIETLLRQSAWSDALALGGETVHEDAGRANEVGKLFAAIAGREAAVDGLLATASPHGRYGESFLAGVVAHRAGRLDRAVALFEGALADNADFLPARIALAELRFDQYAYSESIDLLIHDNADGPSNAKAQGLLGRVYDRLDSVDVAEQHYRRALQLDRSDDGTMLALAEMFFRGGKILEAQRQLKILLQMFPNNEPARELLAMSYLQEEKRDLATQEFRELEMRSKRPTTLARCRVMTDGTLRARPEAVRELLLSALEQGEPDAATWLAIAASYSATELAEQRRAYSNALAIEKGREEALLGLARVAQFELDLEGSAGFMEELLRRRPNQHEWRRRMIELQLVTLNFETAVKQANSQMTRADLDDRDRMGYRAIYVRALSRAERPHEATQQIEAWIKQNPDDRTWSLWLAEHHFAQEKPDLAVEVYETLHMTDRPNRGIRQRLIAALAAADLHNRAAQYCLDWLDQDPDDDQANRLIAAVLADADQLEASNELIRNRLLRTMQREPYQDLWAAQLSTAGRHEAAIQTCEALIDTAIQVLREGPRRIGPEWEQTLREDELIYFPNSPFVANKLHERLESLRLRMIPTLIAARDFRRATDMVTEWLDQAGDPATRHRYLRLLAYCHQSEGHEDRAASALERALMLEPADVGLNNDLAYTWIDQGVRIADAEPLIRYALGHAPDQGAYLDTYGWLLYKKGEFAEAEKWLRRANSARGNNDPVVLDHLGDAAWRMGQKAAAIDHWMKAAAVVADRMENELANADERRVKAQTQQKIDNATTGTEPKVAPLAQPVPPKESTIRTERT